MSKRLVSLICWLFGRSSCRLKCLTRAHFNVVICVRVYVFFSVSISKDSLSLSPPTKRGSENENYVKNSNSTHLQKKNIQRLSITCTHSHTHKENLLHTTQFNSIDFSFGINYFRFALLCFCFVFFFFRFDSIFFDILFVNKVCLFICSLYIK